MTDETERVMFGLFYVDHELERIECLVCVSSNLETLKRYYKDIPDVTQWETKGPLVSDKETMEHTRNGEDHYYYGRVEHIE